MFLPKGNVYSRVQYPQELGQISLGSFAISETGKGQEHKWKIIATVSLSLRPKPTVALLECFSFTW